MKFKRKTFILIFPLLFVVSIYHFYCPLEEFFFSSSSPLADRLEFVNYQSEKSALPLSRDVIAILTPRLSSSLFDRLKSLDERFLDGHSSDLLVFHTSVPRRPAELLTISEKIFRRLFFVNIAPIFVRYPRGFDRCREHSTYWRRGKWNYQQMIRFWFVTLFEREEFQSIEYLLRLDDDSRLLNAWPNLFAEMRQRNASYFANDLDVDEEKNLPGTMRLKTLTEKFIEEHRVNVRQPAMLNEGFGNDSLRTFFNNFEIVRMEFFRRPDVRQWIDYVDQSWGIFRYRWGDAILRYLTVALFLPREQLLHRHQFNLSYCHKC